jgi:putative oxidoreductase
LAKAATTSRGKNMSMSTTPAGEPRPLIPALTPLYSRTRDLSWLVIRVTAGGILLTHGIGKLMSTTVSAFAAGSMARRGIEPSLLAAYIIFFNETIGAICLMLGLFTRFIAAAIAIELAVITFVAHFKNGYGFTSPGGGWEFPLMWGLIVFAIALRGGGPYSVDRKLGWEL